MNVNIRKNTTGYLKERLNEYEKSVIIQSYIKNNKNKVKTAKALGITRNTLRSRLFEYGLISEDSKERKQKEEINEIDAKSPADSKEFVKISFSK